MKKKSEVVSTQSTSSTSTPLLLTGFCASCRNWFQVYLLPCISCWGPGKEQSIGTQDCFSSNLITPNQVWEQGPKEGASNP